MLFFCCLANPGGASEDDGRVVMRFLDSAQASGSVVRLADLVQIVSGSSPSLEKQLDMVLGPGPRADGVQIWRSSDVLQHLQLRGVHPASIRWSGAEQVELHRASELSDTLVDSLTPAFVNERTISQAAANVAQAIHEYLCLRNGRRVDWRIDVNVPHQYANMLQIRRNIASIGGGSEPWIGQQQFVLQVKNAGTLMSLPLDARIELPPMIVISQRAIRREEVLSADLLSYAPLPNRQESNAADFFTNMEDLIGKQARRSISSGLPISADLVSEPIVVQRNDLVEIESVAGGVVVRSSAKALAGGAIGSLIEVEMPSRHRLHATVIGHLLVRVSAVSQSSTNGP